MKRRLKRVRSHEASRAITREKNLANNQFKILDVFRPLLYSWALIGSGESSEENPIYAAVVGAFKLPGHCFNYLSGQRRSNILKVTDPENEDVANDHELFDPKESAYFKMETLSLVRDLVRKGDFFAKLISLALTYLYLCVNKIVHTFNLLGVAYFTVFVPCVLGFPLHHGLSRNC